MMSPAVGNVALVTGSVEVYVHANQHDRNHSRDLHGSQDVIERNGPLAADRAKADRGHHADRGHQEYNPKTKQAGGGNKIPVEYTIQAVDHEGEHVQTRQWGIFTPLVLSSGGNTARTGRQLANCVKGQKLSFRGTHGKYEPALKGR